MIDHDNLEEFRDPQTYDLEDGATMRMVHGKGYKTILDLCEMPNRHLQEHTRQLYSKGGDHAE